MLDIHHGHPCGVCSTPQDRLREGSLPCPGTHIRVGAFRWTLNKSSSSGSLCTCTLSTPRHTPGRRRSSPPQQPHRSASQLHTRACAASSVPSDTASSSTVLAGNGCTDSARPRCRNPRRLSFSYRLVLQSQSRVSRARARFPFGESAPMVPSPSGSASHVHWRMIGVDDRAIARQASSATRCSSAKRQGLAEIKKHGPAYSRFT